MLFVATCMYFLPSLMVETLNHTKPPFVSSLEVTVGAEQMIIVARLMLPKAIYEDIIGLLVPTRRF